MKKSMLWVTLFCLFGMLTAVGAQTLEGTYTVQGWEPGGDHSSTPDYTGVVEVKKRGEGYVFTGTMDNERYEGVGYLGDDQASFNFAYRGSEGDAGISTGRNRSGIWVIYWMSFDALDGRSGHELWRRERGARTTPAKTNSESQ